MNKKKEKMSTVSNAEFEAAKRSIGNIQFCKAYLKAAIYNLEMTLHFTQNTATALETFNKLVTMEAKRIKVEAAQKLSQEGKESEAIWGGATDLANDNELHLEGGHIAKIAKFNETFARYTKDLSTIDVLIETVDLISIAQGYISTNENVALAESQNALTCIESTLLVGLPLESKILEMQFTATTDLKSQASSIQMYNATIGTLSSILQKLYAVSKTLQEDVTDTKDLVDRVRKLAFSRAASTSSGIMQWFTNQNKNTVKSEMILNALESIFSSMDMVTHFSTNAFINIKAIEAKVDVSMITFASIPTLNSNATTSSMRLTLKPF